MVPGAVFILSCLIRKGSAALKPTGNNAVQVFFRASLCGTARNFGTESNDPVNDGFSTVNYNVAVAVKQGDDRVRSLLDTDNVVRVKIHQLFIQACDCDHVNPVVW